MSLIDTGIGKIKGIATSIHNRIMLFSGTSGEEAKESSVTISDTGDVTANAFIGDGSQLTNVPTSGAGSGDVVGPSVSIDNHVVRWDGITGKLIQDSGVVTISDSGAMLGVTSFAVDNLFMNSQTLESTINTDLNLNSTGTGRVNVNGVTFSTNQDIDTNGHVTMYDGDLLVDTGTIYAKGSPALSIKRSGGKGIVEWRDDDTGTRTAWIGKGTSATTDISIRNETSDGNIGFHPTNDNGLGEVISYGFSRLGGTGAPAIKQKLVTGVTGDTEGDVTSIAHGLTAGKIVSVTVLVEYGTNRFMSPGYNASSGYRFDHYIFGSDIKVALHPTNSENILSGGIKVLITYTEG